MKKNRIIIIITIVLVIIAAYLYFTSKKGTIQKELKDFAIEDTSLITRIFLADKSEKRVLLERIKPEHWTVNGKYKARKDLINVLLKTIKTLKVKSPVSRAARDNIIKRLATSAIKAEIYLGDSEEPVKVYYVGGETQSRTGTYMLLENSSDPFIIQIPMFSGYLSTRYTTDEYEWRDKTIFNYPFKDIASVTVEYPSIPNSSFIISNTGDWTYSLRSLINNELIPDCDTTRLKIYLTYFKNIQFEGFIRKLDNAFRDSIISSTPQQIITVSDMSDRSTTIRTFLKPLPGVTFDMAGNQLVYDIDRMYALIDGQKELVTIQFFVFDKLLLGIDDFIEN
ncbi:MAG: DUF4340 domain-containing protein [Bacteroidota bacterium]